MSEFRYFRRHEFQCKCGCQSEGMYVDFLIMLEDARRIAKTPFVITSGYRCEKHNKNVGGKSGSLHLKGLAADIACDSSTLRYIIIESLKKAGFNRIGISKDFIHVDCGYTKIQNVIWIY